MRISITSQATTPSATPRRFYPRTHDRVQATVKAPLSLFSPRFQHRAVQAGRRVTRFTIPAPSPNTNSDPNRAAREHNRGTGELQRAHCLSMSWLCLRPGRTAPLVDAPMPSEKRTSNETTSAASMASASREPGRHGRETDPSASRIRRPCDARTRLRTGTRGSLVLREQFAKAPAIGAAAGLLF